MAFSVRPRSGCAGPVGAPGDLQGGPDILAQQTAE